jgi:hypothetical protein
MDHDTRYFFDLILILVSFPPHLDVLNHHGTWLSMVSS